jgi:hypothetical protein
LSVFVLPLFALNRERVLPTERAACPYCYMLLFLILFVSGILYASVLEWLLHRYVMHRPVGSFRYPFRTHTMVHHRTFKADHTYHLIDEKDREIIPMAWWNSSSSRQSRHGLLDSLAGNHGVRRLLLRGL